MICKGTHLSGNERAVHMLLMTISVLVRVRSVSEDEEHV